MAGFNYHQFSDIELLKNAIKIYTQIDQFDLETQAAITHCYAVLNAGGSGPLYLAERDFLSCLHKLIKVQANEIHYSAIGHQFYYTINGRPDFRVLRGANFFENVNIAIANTETTSPEWANIDPAPSSRSLSPTAPEFFSSGSSPNMATTTTNSSRATTPERPQYSHGKRANLIRQLMGFTLSDFAEYRADTEYYQHICTILFPGQTIDNTTDTPTLFAKWQNDLDIVPSTYEEEGFNFCTKLVY